MYAYSKFRRENANFKINTKVDSEGNRVYVADPSTGSDEPITGLVQILPKGLDAYDFLGMCMEGCLIIRSPVAAKQLRPTLVAITILKPVYWN